MNLEAAVPNGNEGVNDPLTRNYDKDENTHDVVDRNGKILDAHIQRVQGKLNRIPESETGKRLTLQQKLKASQSNDVRGKYRPDGVGRIIRYSGATPSNPSGICHANETVASCHHKLRIDTKSMLSIKIPTSKEAINIMTSDDTITVNATCKDLPLPFNESTPQECWPRTVLLASFPTSGNGLIRQMYHKLTGVIQFTTYGVVEGGVPGLLLPRKGLHYDWDFHHWFMGSWGTFPTAGRTALAKTHMGRRLWYEAVSSNKIPEEYAQVIGGVVRLARNPGDHLLRDAARVKSGHFENDNFEKFARPSCDRATQLASEWVRWHDIWNRFGKSYPHVPHRLLHYERFSRWDTATDVFTELLNFTNEEAIADVNATVHAVIRQPDYEDGKIFAKYCGVQSARSLHHMTRDISEKLGYSFDVATGTWSLDPSMRDYDRSESANLTGKARRY
eukprot:CAMPEP_0172500068 /NCGR_PEP_ID=MMETSP1066-20121228/134295_1 /TAXON_ID=671091 /ORGANISM="Coscinodiscus wailesii, Strain CCMP2513" /LENGTH=446 /DNA_ID=CAMNT_0013274141 /DNA_START=271 /DNA_END=1611 /DNA_ORIENTATION=-